MVRTLALAPTSVTEGTLDRALTSARFGIFTLALIFKKWRRISGFYLCFLGYYCSHSTSAKMESLSLSPSCGPWTLSLLAPTWLWWVILAVTTLALINNQSELQLALVLQLELLVEGTGQL